MDEFNKLLTYVTNNRTASVNFLSLIKKSTAWTSYSNKGIDEFGFGALPAGVYSSGNYSDFGSDGGWWLATEYYSSGAYYLGLGYGSAYVSILSKTDGFSVRCLKDSN